MARRSELQGIANALNESFVSRNNDVNGYWAMGQLKSLATDTRTTSMHFYLTHLEKETHCALYNDIVCRYAKLLARLLRQQQLHDAWISEAFILITFELNTADHRQYHITAQGEPFQSHCQLLDDMGRHYSSTLYGQCFPHSTAHELRSAGN